MDRHSSSLLIAAHGSKQEGATRLLNDHAKTIRARNHFRQVAVGVLTGHGSSIQDAARTIVNGEPVAGSIVVVPYLLGRSRFVSEVIPSQVQVIRETFPCVGVMLSSPLDLDGALAYVVRDLVGERGYEAECGIVLVAHGGEHSQIGEPLARFSEMVSEIITASVVRFGLLEGGGATIGDAIAMCIEKEAEKIFIVPLFLLEGKHAREDVPREVEEARERHPGFDIEITRPVGASSMITEIIERSAIDAICRPDTLNGGP